LSAGLSNLIKHLKTQLNISEALGGDFVYISRREAKELLKIAEARAKRKKKRGDHDDE